MVSYLLNVAIPLFIFEWWYVLLALAGVIVIESVVLWKFLSCNFFTAVILAFKANLVSTLGGYIAQSLIRFFVGLIIFLTLDVGADDGLMDTLMGNIGVGKYEGGSNNPIIFFNFLIAVSCCFILSILIEAKLIQRYAERRLPSKQLLMAVIIGNIISYVLLFFWLAWNYDRALA
ncbi:MAG TPA: hypothetical protein VFP97_17420 [Chitinophagaceae bacterium]|nr:hypothetical protein [Chitinophagaceae bacterium]